MLSGSRSLDGGGFICRGLTWRRKSIALRCDAPQYDSEIIRKVRRAESSCVANVSCEKLAQVLPRATAGISVGDVKHFVPSGAGGSRAIVAQWICGAICLTDVLLHDEPSDATLVDISGPLTARSNLHRRHFSKKIRHPLLFSMVGRLFSGTRIDIRRRRTRIAKQGWRQFADERVWTV